MQTRILGRQLDIFKSRSGLFSWTKLFLLEWLVANNRAWFSSLSFDLLDDLGKSFLCLALIYEIKIRRERSIAQCFDIA